MAIDGVGTPSRSFMEYPREKRLATGALNELYIYIYIYVERFFEILSSLLDRPPSARIRTTLLGQECLKAGLYSRIMHNNGV